MLDQREFKAKIERKNILARSFVEDIVKFYSAKSQKPIFAEIITVACSLLLYGGDRNAVRQFLTQRNVASETELLDAIDSNLKKYLTVTSNENVITELYIIESLLKYSVTGLMQLDTLQQLNAKSDTNAN